MTAEELQQRRAEVRRLDEARAELAPRRATWQAALSWIVRAALAIAIMTSFVGLWSGMHTANQRIDTLLERNRALQAQITTLEDQIEELGGTPAPGVQR
jgi:type II secretory pathway component PulM